MPIQKPMSELQVHQSPHRFRDDRGFILIEVLVSAIMLVTISLAVFATLSKADSAAGQQQARALAANVAQAELEKIRSLPVEDIADLRGDRIVTYSGQKYPINTVAKWVTDGADEPECTTRTGGLDYLRVTVTVKFPKQAGAAPVTFTSLVTPSAGAGGGDTGSVSIHLQDRNADPDPGITVTLDGPSTFTGVTNKNGCVVFGFVPESASYTVRFAQGGYVDRNSVNVVADPTTVTGGQTTKLTYDYDQGGFTAVRFKTRLVANTDVDTSPINFSFFNGGQDTNGQVTITPTAGATSWDGQVKPNPLFPFNSPYAIYAGSCAANSVPSNIASTQYAGDQQVPKFVNITPNTFQNAGTMYIPALDPTVMTGSAPGASTQGALADVGTTKIMVDTGCTPIWTRALSSPGKLSASDSAFPYSLTAKVCAMGYDNTSGVRLFKKVVAATAVANTQFKQATVVPTLYLKNGTVTSPSSSSCFA